LISLVLDASVAAKWFVLPGEPLEQEAIHLLAACQNGALEFLVPDLFWAEMSQIFWKAVRTGRSGKQQAEDSLAMLQQQQFPTFPSASLVESAFAIAHKFDRSFYDSLYVALAVTRRATLITADERLANALAAHLPVKWLGAWPATR
jgi:predicted nucleic acid-binding protein